MTDGTAPTQATPEDLFHRLDDLGIDYQTHHHRPVFTVEESRDLRGTIPGAHCKSLFVRDKKGRMFLVVVLEDRRMDLKALSALLDCGRLSFGSPERLMTYLGVTPGSVTPFALINDPDGQVQPVLDAEMMQADLVNYHPLQNDMMTSVSPADLRRFVADCGHAALELDLAPATAAAKD